MGVIGMDEKKTKTDLKERRRGIAFNQGNCTCCDDEKMNYTSRELKKLPEEAVLELGCVDSTVLAELREGEVVLAIGAGLDVFLASHLVGGTGRVISLDSDQQLVKMAQEGGYHNLEFIRGAVENIPLDDDGVDVVISNCAINQATQKQKALEEISRILKPRGRLMALDLVTEGELDITAGLECLDGALQEQEYLNTIFLAGFEMVEILTEADYQEPHLDPRWTAKIKCVGVKALKGCGACPGTTCSL